MTGDREAGHVTLVAHEVGTPGGMESQLAELAGGLLARGWRITVIARACALAPDPGLRFVRVGGPRRPFSLWFPWFSLLGSLAVLRHGRGIVHTTGALVLNHADVSTVHFCHRAFHRRTGVRRAGRDSPGHRLNAAVAGWMARTAEVHCYRPHRTRRLAAVSGGLARELGELFPAMADAIQAIPNGVDTAEYSPDPAARSRVRESWGVGDDTPVALFVGSEWERKGLEYAIGGVAGTRGWHMVVVGEGDTERYRRLAEAAGAGDRVRFHGGVERTAPLYAGADAFVLPSAYETFSLVTFEAAASGLPLLVSRVSGVEDILEEGRNGWFIDRDAEMITQRLEALEDGAKRQSMGAAAREDSERFGWDCAVDAYDRLYRLLGSR